MTKPQQFTVASLQSQGFKITEELATALAWPEAQTYALSCAAAHKSAASTRGALTRGISDEWKC